MRKFNEIFQFSEAIANDTGCFGNEMEVKLMNVRFEAVVLRKVDEDNYGEMI